MNKVKNLSKQKIGLLILLGCILSLWLIFRFVLKNPIWNDRTSLTPNTALLYGQEIDYGAPVRLKIPKINVDAAIDPMGLTPDGAMEAPNGPKNAGWFKLGPRPGNTGSAVIDGHYGPWKTGEGSVFDDLSKLQPGDKIYVQDEHGSIITFVVRESRRYDSEANASDVFVSNDGAAHLNLITCEGIWNEKEKTRPYRLVVFTDREVK